MDLNFTQEENAFRDEVRKFFRENIPPALHKKLIDGGHPSKEDIITWTRILNKKGWACPLWPQEYGGTDWDAVGRLTPRGRVGTPEDIAGLTIYLSSRAGAFTVGEVITCDGGAVVS